MHQTFPKFRGFVRQTGGFREDCVTGTLELGDPTAVTMQLIFAFVLENVKKQVFSEKNSYSHYIAGIHNKIRPLSWQAVNS